MEEKSETITEEQLQFVLPEDNRFPVVIFEGLPPLEIKDKISVDFIAMQERGMKAERYMTEEEINGVRAEYGDLAESRIPELRSELDKITAEYKVRKENLVDRIAALDTQFKDLVHVAKQGTAEYEPEPGNAFKIPVSGHYLYYAWTGTKFQLIEVKPIPDGQRYDLFNTGDKNKESFEAAGYSIPDFPIENRERYRVVELGKDDYVEIWEENGRERASHHWIEDSLDEDTGTVVSVDRHETGEFEPGENPYENGKIETQEGAAGKIPCEPEG
ncbi:hypothetical protein [Limibacterium fermenti]|uniref:hypothetical protein n=1 Tax=Limibacterium fermenti TaxID=3229863 RepID=UPI003A6FDE37